jgi:hypothetical protein
MRLIGFVKLFVRVGVTKMMLIANCTVGMRGPTFRSTLWTAPLRTFIINVNVVGVYKLEITFTSNYIVGAYCNKPLRKLIHNDVHNIFAEKSFEMGLRLCH